MVISKCERNITTSEEMDFYKQCVAQVAFTKRITDHLNELLKVQTSNSKRETKEGLTGNNVNIDAYGDGSIAVNHCMNMAKNGNTIMNAMTAASSPKIRDPSNWKHLEAICVQTKKLKLLFEIRKTM